MYDESLINKFRPHDLLKFFKERVDEKCLLTSIITRKKISHNFFYKNNGDKNFLFIYNFFAKFLFVLNKISTALNYFFIARDLLRARYGYLFLQKQFRQQCPQS